MVDFERSSALPIRLRPVAMLRVQLLFLAASARLFVPAGQPVQPAPQLVPQPLRATSSAAQAFAVESSVVSNSNLERSFCYISNYFLITFVELVF